MATLILDEATVEALLDHDALIEALTRAHRELATGGAVQPAPVAMHHPAAGPGDLGAALVPMTAYAPYLGVCAVKLLADVPLNRGRGLPAQRSTIALYSGETAECLALVDGRTVTRMRTAAATAVATRALARPESGVLGLVGAGPLAIEHVAAMARVLPLREVVVWSPGGASARALAERFGPATAPAAWQVRPVGSVAEVLAAADVVCTLTPASEPLVDAAMLRPGQHVNAVGSPPRPAFRELTAAAVGRADLVVVDSRAVAEQESGNIRTAVAADTLRPADLVELGEVLAGVAPGRADPAQVTVFNSVGIGLQDLAAVELLHRRARGQHRGTELALRPTP